jgi:hypothetical protein
MQSEWCCEVLKLILFAELSEIMGVFESIYGFLPVQGGMYGPLVMSKPTKAAKTLVCLISEVTQVLGLGLLFLIYSGV